MSTRGNAWILLNSMRRQQCFSIWGLAKQRSH
nr:MAG TPA: hypothetical protein [Caudoviricetes sp.]